MFVVHLLEHCVVLFEEMSLFIVCSICSSVLPEFSGGELLL